MPQVKPVIRRLLVLLAAILLLALLVLFILNTAQHPVARIRVVDSAGNPVADAVVKPEGLRTKPGPYRSGWYGWSPRHGVPNSPVKTDSDGYATVPYPKYVFERLETGTLCLSVQHPDYVPDRPERIVATAPPAGAPWRQWLDYALARVRVKALVDRPDPIVLQKGAILKVSARADASQPTDASFFAQISGIFDRDPGFWVSAGAGSIITRQLPVGSHTVRAVQIDHRGAAWFSGPVNITAQTGLTNELIVDLKPGLAVRGRLGAEVPRPVTNGRVVAHVWPSASTPSQSPPQWHSWAAVQPDGTFEITALPPGDLEIVALCDGFVSTNGSGQSGMRYPQKFVLTTNDLAVEIGMEATARLEVTVTNDRGQPLPGVGVVAWPNVRYGEWAATILASDCYRTADRLRDGPPRQALARQEVPDFQGTSDSNGVAVLPNLPATVRELAVKHEKFDLPPIQDNWGQQRRQATVVLIAGRTNFLTLRLEPREKSSIHHY